MRTVKTIVMYLILAVVFVMCQGIDLSYDVSGDDLNAPEPEFQIEIPEPIPFIESVDCFEYAELVTGFSAEVLRGIAATESRFRVKAVGDDGMSLGMFQLHSRWHKSRVEKWGEFNPIDPFESAVIAGYIMQENLIAFDGDLRMAIAAYRQGVRGVRKNGVIGRYVEEILNWRNDSEKILSLFIFQGITDIEVQRDGYKGSGAQDSYKLDNSLAAQISGRRSSRISYQ
jgi:hypothetical protein